MKYTSLMLLAVMCLVACDNAYDAEKVAESYCDCMKRNNAVEDFDKASLICDTKFIAENRYYKLWAIDMSDRELDKNVSDETRDSVKLFINTFTIYLNRYCCKETLGGPDSTEVKVK